MRECPGCRESSSICMLLPVTKGQETDSLTKWLVQRRRETMGPFDERVGRTSPSCSVVGHAASVWQRFNIGPEGRRSTPCTLSGQPRPPPPLTLPLTQPSHPTRISDPPTRPTYPAYPPINPAINLPFPRCGPIAVWLRLVRAGALEPFGVALLLLASSSHSGARS